MVMVLISPKLYYFINYEFEYYNKFSYMILKKKVKHLLLDSINCN